MDHTFSITHARSLQSRGEGISNVVFPSSANITVKVLMEVVRRIIWYLTHVVTSLKVAWGMHWPCLVKAGVSCGQAQELYLAVTIVISKGDVRDVPRKALKCSCPVARPPPTGRANTRCIHPTFPFPLRSNASMPFQCPPLLVIHNPQSNGPAHPWYPPHLSKTS